MISVEEARERVRISAEPMVGRPVPIVKATGQRLSAGIKAPTDLPIFNQSAMDGYAVSEKPQRRSGRELEYRVVTQIKAGDPPFRQLKAGTAARIFTGAAVPANAHCVVIQEVVRAADDVISFSEEHFRQGASIRLRGNQIRRGEVALEKGAMLTPSAVGFLLSLGVSKVPVFKRPVVSVMGTGDELLEAGARLRPGKIFESNTGMLVSALSAHGFSCRTALRVKDKIQFIKSKLSTLLNTSDVVVICGGVSAGKYDLVRQALEKLKVTEIFYQISQKPGKPTWFGKKGKKLVFALPGNPAAVLTGFYVYVLPTLLRMAGHPSPDMSQQKLPLQSDFDLKSDRDLFLRARASSEGVSILGGQDSDNLKSFTEANSLVFLKAGLERIHKGTPVDVYWLPTGLWL